MLKHKQPKVSNPLMQSINSFEEKIDNMIKAKIALGDMSVAVGEKNLASMSQEEISALMKLG